MTNKDFTHDEYFVDELLFARKKPALPEHLKLKTMMALREEIYVSQKVAEKEKKLFNALITLFSIIIVLIGVTVALNLQLFEAVYAAAQGFLVQFRANPNSDAIFTYLKYAVLIAALIPAVILFYKDKTSTSGRHKK